MVWFLRFVAVWLIYSAFTAELTPVIRVVFLVLLALLFVKAPAIAARRQARKAEKRSPKSAVAAPVPVAPLQATAPAAKTENFRVAGISYHMADFMELAQEDPDYSSKKSEIIENGLEDQRVYKFFFAADQVELIPEPENIHDPNAVAVYADGHHIGYIKAGSCSRVKNLLASGRIRRISLDAGGGPYVYYDSDAKTFDADEAPYGAKVIISLS